MKFKKTIALISSACVIISCSVGYSASVQDLQKQKSQVQSQMDSLKSQIGQIQDQRNDLGDQIAALNKKIGTVQNSLDDVNDKLRANQNKLDSVTAQIAEDEKKQKEQKDTLKKRLVVYYENDNTSYLDILLNSQNLTDLLERYELIKELVNYDNEIIADILATEKELNDKKAELEVTKAEIQVQKDSYEKIKAQFQSDKADRDKLLNKLTDSQKQIEQELEKEEEASNRIQRQIQQLQGGTSNTKYTGGKLAWPAPGYYNITSSFGWRTHPVLGYKKFHSGIDIAVPSGVAVHAAGDGTVIVAAYDSGYGNYVIIDHGGGVSTLYAHNTSLLVKAGQKVTRGQTVSKSGSTGLSTGPHVHFEVRKSGSPTDPMGWVK